MNSCACSDLTAAFWRSRHFWWERSQYHQEHTRKEAYLLLSKTDTYCFKALTADSARIVRSIEQVAFDPLSVVCLEAPNGFCSTALSKCSSYCHKLLCAGGWLKVIGSAPARDQLCGFVPQAAQCEQTQGRQKRCTSKLRNTSVYHVTWYKAAESTMCDAIQTLVWVGQGIMKVPDAAYPAS